MSHYYKKGEFSLPSVTTIIDELFPKDWGPPWGAKMVVEWIKRNCDQPWLDANEDAYVVFPDELEDAKKHFREVSRDALDIGSAVHKIIEEFLKTGKEPRALKYKKLDKRTRSSFNAFLEFQEAHKMTPIELEFTVYGDYWAGTLDYYGWFDGKLYVIDFKTSAAHYPNQTGPQIAAYRSRVNAKVEGCGILRLDKQTGKPDWRDFSKRYRKDLEHFNLMLPVYMIRHPRIAKAAGWDTKPF